MKKFDIQNHVKRSIRIAGLICLILNCTSKLFAQASATWNLTTSNTPVVCGSLTATAPTNGVGVTSVTSANATSGYSGVGFPTGLPAANYNNAANTYIQYSITNTSASAITVTGVNFTQYYNGPSFIFLAMRYSTNNFTSSTLLYSGLEVDPIYTGYIGTTSIAVPAATTLTFRVYGYFADNTTVRFGNTFFQVISGPAVPVTFTATPISGTQIDLAGTANAAGDNVMLVYNTTNTFGFPTQGTNYVAGNTIPGGGTVLYVGAAGAPFFNHTGLTPGTTYYYRLYSKKTTCTLYSTYLAANATTLYPYCIPTATTPANYYISQVSFVGNLIDATNTSTYTTGFQNFTGLTPIAWQAQGEGVNVYVQSNFSTLIKAWVDWNNDGAFAAGELVYTSNGTLTSTTTFGFTILSTTAPGDYTIRIRTTRNGAGTYDACGNLADGEAEDYKFRVIASCPAIITTVADGEVCGSGAVNLAATGSAGTTLYKWYAAPSGGSPIATTVAGTWTTPSLITTTTYYVTAFNGTCESLTRTAVIAKVSPVPVLSFSPAIPIVCGEGAVLQLNAAGDTEEGILINEKFNSGTGSFTVNNINISPAGSTAQAQWQNATSPFIPSYTTVWHPAMSSGISSNTFVFATSDISSTTVNTALESPTVNSTSYTSLSLNFDMYYSHYLADNNVSIIDSVIVEVATNAAGNNWVNVVNYVADQGIGTKFLNKTVNLNSYINITTLKVRIRYYGVWTDGVGLDNIKLSGTKPLSTSFSWSPAGGGNLFTDVSGTIPYVSGSVPNVYIKPTPAQIAAGTDLVFTATATLSNGCFASTPVTVRIGPSQWVGTASSDWFNINNWCSKTIPSLTTIVEIPSGTPNNPLINTAANCAKITIFASATLTINSAGSLTVPGDFINQGTLANGGKIVLNGITAQSFPGASGIITAMNTLEINNSGSGVTLNRSIFIDSVLKPTAGNLALGNNDITIRSSATTTAAVSTVGASAGFTYGSGAFVVERYINTGNIVGQHGKSWQLLAAPTTGQKIKASWMEGAAANADPSPGYGTQIAGTTGSPGGFDATAYLPSMKTYVPATNTWVEVGNPNTTDIHNTQGYFIFIRGDRSVINFSGANSTPKPTRLRTRGTIQTGPVSSPLVTAGLFQCVANPYPSAVDFSTVTKTGGVNPNFYVFDPTLAGTRGLGGYQTITAVTGYRATPGNFASTSTIYNTTSNYKNIQSGAAFFVRATGTNGTLNFAETNKAGGSMLANRESEAKTHISMLSTNLFALNATGSVMLSDGNRVVFNNNYRNGIDADDAVKLMNASENFGLSRAGSILAVEARKRVISNDTLFYNITLMRQGIYKLMFIPENMAVHGLTAELIDLYLNTRTAVSLTDTSYADISITADPLSASDNRFMLVFRSARTGLSTTHIIISATSNSDHSTKVNWDVTKDAGFIEYTIERSGDGRNFSPINTVTADKNTSYEENDLHPLQTDNYYRIKANNGSSIVQYSNIVKSNGTDNEKNEITVYPNPITGKKIHVLFTGQPTGIYMLQLTNKNGQVIQSGPAEVKGYNFVKTILLGKDISAGIYQLKITAESGEVVSLQVLVP